MSSHHESVPQMLQLDAPAAAPRDAQAGPNGAGNGVAHFYDQQTAQLVTAYPVTAANRDDLRATYASQTGASALTGPAPEVGYWIVAQGNGAAALAQQVVNGPDFLRRYFPADDAARNLLRYLGLTAGGAGAGGNGNGNGAAARLATYDVITA